MRFLAKRNEKRKLVFQTLCSFASNQKNQKTSMKRKPLSPETKSQLLVAQGNEITEDHI